LWRGSELGENAGVQTALPGIGGGAAANGGAHRRSWLAARVCTGMWHGYEIISRSAMQAVARRALSIGKSSGEMASRQRRYRQAHGGVSKNVSALGIGGAWRRRSV
jgi:hypothetical protein